VQESERHTDETSGQTWRRRLAIGGVALAAILAGGVFALLVSGRSEVQPLAAEPSPTPSAEQPTPSPSASLVPSPSPSASPTVEPTPATTATATPTASPTAVPTPTPFGAGVFAAPDSCINPEIGYRVAYPASWYSNAAIEGIAACWAFGPTDSVDYRVAYGTGISYDGAITFHSFEQGTGPEGDDDRCCARVISSQETTVAGLPARYQELEMTEQGLFLGPGDRWAEYVITLADGSYLVASTYRGPYYETSKAVLDQMMLTLEFVSP
jgi:hypothetical protein